MTAVPPSEIIHASCVCSEDKAVLILGASGQGKSSLALQLISLGAMLVADDRTQLTVQDCTLIATCPPAITGLIEARGVGILRLPVTQTVPVTLVVDLDQTEEARLPTAHHATQLGITLPCLWHAPSPHFALSVLHCLRHGINHTL